jgi:DNA-binding response OmpR family regulator
MITSVPARSEHRVPQPQTSKKNAGSKLLIVTDSVERAASLRASLDTDRVEVTCITSPADLSLACRCGHDLAVVDVGASEIVEVLKGLRSSAGCETISVLVQASRLASDPSLTGVLPAYRAMPCSQADLIALARRRLTASGKNQRLARKML